MTGRGGVSSSLPHHDKVNAGMGKRIIKYEVVVNGQVHPAETLTEAEKKLNSLEKLEILPYYILRKEYSERGRLLEEYYVG
jgi:hypothetical protein